MGLAFPDPPVDLPRFAEFNLVDPTTGENNVVEPSSDVKNYGWYPFRKRPERNIMNWIHRITYQQLDYWVNTFFPSVDTFADSAWSAITALQSDVSALQGQMSTLVDAVEVGSVPASMVVDPLSDGRGWSSPVAGSAGAPRGPIDVTGVNTDSHWYDFTLNYMKIRDLVFLSFPKPFMRCAINITNQDGWLEILSQPASWDLPDAQNVKLLLHFFDGIVDGNFEARGTGHTTPTYWPVRSENHAAAAVDNYHKEWWAERSLADNGIMGQTVVLQSQSDAGWPV